MDKETEKQLKKKLEAEKKRLTKDLEFFAKKNPKVKWDWRTIFPFFSGRASDRDESAEEIETYGNLLPVEHTVELRLKDVERALRKLKNGKYGKCEKCKKDIETKRLKAIPEARLCISCGKKNNNRRPSAR